MWIRSWWLNTCVSWQRASWRQPKGPKKAAQGSKEEALADALDRTIETGASTADMGHAVEARYKGMVGGKSLDDLDMMEQAHDAVASAKKNACKGEF